MLSRTFVTPNRESSPSSGGRPPRTPAPSRGGNQAHLRFLMARSALTPTPRGPEDVVRRQTAPQAASKPGPTWRAKDISAGIQLVPGTCFSERAVDGTLVSEKGTGLFSEACPGSICARQPLPLRLLYHVDGITIPRPQPFDPSKVSLSIRFAGKDGDDHPVFKGASEGTYAGPGAPLKTTFGETVPFTPPEAGTVYVSLSHLDPSTGGLAVYSDAIPVVDCPQAPPRPGGAVPTGVYVLVRDPKNNPLQHERVGKNTNAEGQGVIVEVERDGNGLFYRVEGAKYYIPEMPPVL